MAKSARDSSKISINNNYFQGGDAIDLKLAVANSFYQSRNLDFRTFPSQISVLPAPSAISTSLSDLILGIEQDLDGVRWAIGSAGYLYKINTSNTVTTATQLSENGSAGILYNQVTDQLYIPGQTCVSMYGQVTGGSPSLRSNQFAQSASTSNGCVNLFNDADGFFDGNARNNCQSLGVGVTSINQVTTNATQTYSVPTTLSETSGNFCFFAPDIEPFYSIAVYVTDKGTGDWTLTLHDSLNNDLAAVTIANADLTSTAYNEFVFSSQVRALVSASQTGTSATYHFHLTSTVDDGTAGTLTAGDLSTCDFLLFAYRLVETKNSWHPTALFTGSGQPLLCIGNGNYLSTYNFGNDANPTNSQWIRHQLFFKPGYEVCGITTTTQYLVIGVERRSNNSSRNFQDGVLYFWDGTTSAPNIAIDIPMGAPYGLYSFNNIVYFACAGSLFAWSGGQTVIKVRKLAYQNTDYLGEVDNTIVNPNMFASRYNLLMLGYPSTTTNPQLNYGVYSWGTVELTFPNSLTLSYQASNGYLNNVSPISNLSIGCVVNFVDDMYISWSYMDSDSITHYGIDLLDNFSYAALNAYWISLIYDGGSRFKQKLANRLKISFAPLPEGCSVTPFYILDRGSEVDGTAISTTGATDALQEINLRFHEIQYGFKISCPNSLSTAPIITGVTLEVDPLGEELEVAPDN